VGSGRRTVLRVGRVGWEGASKGWSSMRASWLGADGVSFSFSFSLRVAQVRGSVSGRVAGAGCPSTSSTTNLRPTVNIF